MRPSSPGPALRWGALAALAGGLAVVVGVFLDWATLTSVGTVLAPVETITGVAGIRHWTGFAALLAAGVAVLGAIGAGFFEDAAGRRAAALVAAGSALAALLATGLGFTQREAIATTGFPGGPEALAFARDFAREFNAELDIDIPAPRVETGTGLPVAAVGSLVAAAGGVVALRQEARHRGSLHFGR